MKTSIEIEIGKDNSSIVIPFDNDNEGKYEFSIDPENCENGDGIILRLNKKACLYFMQIFGQLAFGSYNDGYHVHLGYEQNLQPGPGVRIILNDSEETTE